jgi:predicted transcriptional regulator YdeE
MPKLSVNKSTFINASLDQVHATVRDFREWPKWSPWLIADPECKVSYSEDGRSYSWVGKIAGSGEMAITGEDAPRSIQYQLTFLKPWKSVSVVSFSFTERDKGMDATWTMDSSLPFFMFWMKSMMTAFVGMDYQRGLNMLKDYVEMGSTPSKLVFHGTRPSPGFHYVGIKNACPISDLAPRMEKDFEKLRTLFKENGKSFSIYHKWDMVKSLTEYTSGFPVENVPSTIPEGFISGEAPSCEVYSIEHTGPYRHLGNAWSSGYMHMRTKLFRQNKKIAPFEIYGNEPQNVSENDLITTVHFPVK